jgi:hypothetical protein
MARQLAYCADQAAQSIDRANWRQAATKRLFPARTAGPIWLEYGPTIAATPVSHDSLSIGFSYR